MIQTDLVRLRRRIEQRIEQQGRRKIRRQRNHRLKGARQGVVHILGKHRFIGLFGSHANHRLLQHKGISGDGRLTQRGSIAGGWLCPIRS